MSCVCVHHRKIGVSDNKYRYFLKTQVTVSLLVVTHLDFTFIHIKQTARIITVRMDTEVKTEKMARNWRIYI